MIVMITDWANNCDKNFLFKLTLFYYCFKSRDFKMTFLLSFFLFSFWYNRLEIYCTITLLYYKVTLKDRRLPDSATSSCCPEFQKELKKIKFEIAKLNHWINSERTLLCRNAAWKLSDERQVVNWWETLWLATEQVPSVLLNLSETVYSDF